MCFFSNNFSICFSQPTGCRPPASRVFFTESDTFSPAFFNAFPASPSPFLIESMKFPKACFAQSMKFSSAMRSLSSITNTMYSFFNTSSCNDFTMNRWDLFLLGIKAIVEVMAWTGQVFYKCSSILVKELPVGK